VIGPKTDVGRRRFLRDMAGVAGAAAALSLTQTLRAVDSVPSRIIDTHVHFYDPTRAQGVPWPPKTDALLYRTVLPKHLRELTAGLGITGVIVVEASAWLEDNQWILDLAKDEPLILGFIGNLPPAQPAFKDQLRRFSANPLFRGIRISGRTLIDQIDKKEFVEDLNRLSDAGLALDLVGDPSLFSPAAALAEKFPTLRSVLDHLPMDEPKDPSKRDAIREALRRLSTQKNVIVKVSAVARRPSAGGEPIADAEFYKPSLDALWTLFGQNRLMYGSNWPVSDKIAPYPAVLKIVRDYFATKPADAVEDFFWRNSQTAYQWRKRA